jgi:hypothetical protein
MGSDYRILDYRYNRCNYPNQRDLTKTKGSQKLRAEARAPLFSDSRVWFYGFLANRTCFLYNNDVRCDVKDLVEANTIIGDVDCMVQTLLSQLTEIIDSNEDIRLNEIPDYRLYISQLEEFFNKKLGKVSSNEEDRKTISKTMIQNYIKDGLLMPPDGKSYYRSHVILLILIYNLKPILSIRDIGRLLHPILSDIYNEENRPDIDYIYESYLSLKQESISGLHSCLEDLAHQVSNHPLPEGKTIEEQHQIRLLLFISALITEANFRKRVADFLIEEYFGDEE